MVPRQEKTPKYLFAIIDGQVACGKVISYMKWKDSYDITFNATATNPRLKRTEHVVIHKIIPAAHLFLTQEETQNELTRIRQEIAKARAEAEKVKQEQALKEAKDKIEEQLQESQPENT